MCGCLLFLCNMESKISESKVRVAAQGNSRNPGCVYFCLSVGQLPCLQGSCTTFGHCDLFPDRIKEGKVKLDKGGSKLSFSHLKRFPQSLIYRAILFYI